ncbi:NAD(P)H-hydrate dehydratase [Ramlibacter sp.]|uniref:NAD(P)H-hydrate dehydratase n=1 Tax=Ramlibacter sp. TaxID=1917967 RepID=UPI002BAA2A6D|nr:NAD(P)H-hydrate dehydratase [Ramlibacter sp.]HWI84619.1 NAD(P)H-hydrate dehydratase [Ramlibacter sp.]
MARATAWTTLDPRLLRRWPLPTLAPDADKEERGRVLIVAGSREIPGAALLAGIAALRAGAGKLVIATAASVAKSLALALPEARVIALPETGAGSFAPEGLELVAESARHTRTALLGPGLMDAAGTCRFLEDLLPLLAHAPVILDALAMDLVRRQRRFAQPVLLTPHAGEMAHLTGDDKDGVLGEPEAAVVDAAQRWHAVVALKGATTLIATPLGQGWRHESSHPGLATSGSGDVLAGVIAGLAAQQPPLEQACAWGVVLHAQAGAALGRRMGPVGYLARELPAEIPAQLSRLQARSARAA